jgi:hypothetical protein
MFWKMANLDQKINKEKKILNVTENQIIRIKTKTKTVKDKTIKIND